MPAAIFEDEDSPPIDPDDLKMPESPRHRRACDLIGLVAANLLGDGHDVFRDMNWYPTDGGPAMAPDVMILPAGAWVAPPDMSPAEPLKSYRQDRTGGPPPSVVVEVPSASDGFTSLLAKVGRCQRLGTVAYLVSVDEPQTVLRCGPDDALLPVDRLDSKDWIDQPIPELGGLRIGFDGDDLAVELPDGTRVTSDEELVASIQRRAASAEGRVASAEGRIASAESQATEAQDRAARTGQQAERLRQKLRELGVDPDD